jgi:hypothetical protein
MMNKTTFSANPGQVSSELPEPMMQEAGLGASASAEEAAIEQIVADIRADADSQAYAFIP